MSIDDTNEAAPHPAWLPWGTRNKGSGVRLLSRGKDGQFLFCPPTIICSSRKPDFLTAKAAKAGLAVPPKTPGVPAARCHADRGCCERAHTDMYQHTPNPALCQPLSPGCTPKICFSSRSPGSKMPAAVPGARRAPGASSALPASLAFCSQRGCACVFSRAPGKWEFNHGQPMQEGRGEVSGMWAGAQRRLGFVWAWMSSRTDRRG